jgi:predicted dehydrogenase
MQRAGLRIALNLPYVQHRRCTNAVRHASSRRALHNVGGACHTCSVRALLRGQWQDGLLDFHREPDEYRIRVLAMSNLALASDAYFIRDLRVRLVWNYLSQIGPVMILRKVASRLQERSRNEKWLSVGIGVVQEIPRGGDLRAGDHVAFVAPSHPACVERVVLRRPLMIPWPGPLPAPCSDRAVLHWRDAERSDGAIFEAIRGWSPCSGVPLPADLPRSMRETAIPLLQATDWPNATSHPASASDEPHEFRVQEEWSERARPSRAGRRAAIFGYGHYAKTIIVPNVESTLSIDAVHEIDPTQIPARGVSISRWDTAATPRPDENYDVYFLAGYHHTHAPLAVEAMNRGAYAVVEKPLAVDDAQLDALLTAMARSDRGLFACFHRRYSPLNKFALRDLGQRPGGAINYHCIVYEVRLPQLHWYRWPTSRSRLVSNGCHWIDQFLWLNGYSDVHSSEIFRAPDGTVNCSAVLRNGAVFTMVLTEVGSERIGLQDHVELRAGDRTVRIIDNTRYRSEDNSRVIRTLRVAKGHAYKRMYREIAKRVAAGEGGDSLASVRISTRLVLDLDAKLAQLENEKLPLLRSAHSTAA